MAIITKAILTKYSSTGMDAEKLRMEAGTGIIDNGMGCPEKLKNTIAIWSTNPTSGYLS